MSKESSFNFIPLQSLVKDEKLDDVSNMTVTIDVKNMMMTKGTVEHDASLYPIVLAEILMTVAPSILLIASITSTIVSADEFTSA